MRASKVDFQALIIVVIHLAVMLTAKMAVQVHAVQMLFKLISIEEVLFAEVAPRMRQNLGASVAGRVTVLYVLAQRLHVIYALLADEHGAAFEADFAESLLMHLLHVPSQALLVRELLLVGATRNETSQLA